MKSLFIFLLIASSFDTFAQKLSISDIEDFSFRMAKKKQYDDFTKVGQYVIMKNALHKIYKREPLESEIGEAFEIFSKKQSIYDNFFYEAVIGYQANTEMARMVLFSLCGNMQLSIKIVSYVKKKYELRIKNDLLIEERKNALVVLKRKEAEELKLRKKVYQQAELSIIPQIKNGEKLESVLDGIFIDQNKTSSHELYTQKFYSIAVKIHMYLDTLGKVKVIAIKPINSSEIVENISGQVDLSFVSGLIFSPGIVDGKKVNCEFDFVLERYYLVTADEFRVDKKGQIKLTSFESNTAVFHKNTLEEGSSFLGTGISRKYEIVVDRNNTYYKPIIDLISQKGKYNVLYIANVLPISGSFRLERIISVVDVE